MQWLSIMKNILFFIFYFSASHLLAAIEVLHLPLGQDLQVPLNSSRVWIEDSKILRGEPLGPRLRLQGLREGGSLLSIGDKKYQIYVIHPKKQNAYKEIGPLLDKMLGLKLEFVKGDLSVSGELLRLQDWKNLSEKLKNSEIDYKMMANFDNKIAEEARQYFAKLFEKHRLPPQVLLFSNSVELRLPLQSPHIHAFRKILSPYGISVIEDSKSLGLEPTIRVQITVAEVQKEFAQNIGVSWPGSYQAQVVPDAMWNFENIEAVANLFERTGQGRVLASPNLISRSGQEAEFLAGGEFPIKVSSFKNSAVVWKKYGIHLKVKPVADPMGQIHLKIDTEVSSLDKARTVDGIPAILMHKVSSQFDLTKTQTVVLSGLIKNEESENSAGLPWISRIPILGALFSSKEFNENRTELVIFVKPEVVDFHSVDQKKMNHIQQSQQ